MQNIVVLTGAGISAESGLKTFRDNDGLWEQHRVEDVATPEAFSRDPALVYRFYNERRAQLQEAGVEPNAAHVALAKLQLSENYNVTVVTQNVDNLHERAGSNGVIHMHGELLSARCQHSGHRWSMTDSFDAKSRCHCCQLPSSIRPDIVWFGEMPLHMDTIYDALLQADLFISVGTSGNVYPAAGFVREAKLNGAHTVELNLEPSYGQHDFMEGYYGNATEVVPKFVESLLTKRGS
ncbi:Sir2 family NAD+-dependent deacetylase [Aestuariibacter salexigens]|uniref:Sir2 family NAD+-dependent deacetylase n=1 Tax=Aestuariibacter salexigens TaxID=226010 RepID=UPI000416B9BA|nr:Sir2 family NAD+-dependent deacetylase [Aestuariibacter salexigens]